VIRIERDVSWVRDAAVATDAEGVEETLEARCRGGEVVRRRQALVSRGEGASIKRRTEIATISFAKEARQKRKKLAD